MTEIGSDISAGQRCWEHVRASITKMGMHVHPLEEKVFISEKDKAILPQVGKELERLDEQHKKLHLEVLD